jgi:hypothetical protein
MWFPAKPLTTQIKFGNSDLPGLCGEFKVPIPSSQTRLGTSNSKGALGINTLLVHLQFRSSQTDLPQRDGNFGLGALVLIVHRMLFSTRQWRASVDSFQDRPRARKEYFSFLCRRQVLFESWKCIFCPPYPSAGRYYIGQATTHASTLLWRAARARLGVSGASSTGLSTSASPAELRDDLRPASAG